IRRLEKSRRDAAGSNRPPPRCGVARCLRDREAPRVSSGARTARPKEGSRGITGLLSFRSLLRIRAHEFQRVAFRRWPVEGLNRAPVIALGALLFSQLKAPVRVSM